MKNLLLVILVGFSLTASAEPETLKLSSFATLSDKERGDILISKSQRIGFDEWVKRFGGSNVSTTKLSGTEFKTFVGKASTEELLFYFYKAPGHELIVSTSQSLKSPEAKKAELQRMVSTLAVK
jgi:hypothetical protein